MICDLAFGIQWTGDNRDFLKTIELPFFPREDDRICESEFGFCVEAVEFNFQTQRAEVLLGITTLESKERFNSFANNLLKSGWIEDGK